jgi:hypothetical protein
MTEDDTFRILKRRPFEEARAAIILHRWNTGIVNYNHQAEIDILWSYSWRTGEYISEVNERGLKY